MKPERIFIVRHAESVGNVDRNIYSTTPDYAIPLTTKGKIQAANCGVELKKKIGGAPAFFYVSPFRRTRETFTEIVRAFEGNSINYREDPRLREQEWATRFPSNGFDEKQEDERFKYGHFYYRFEGAESCADVYDRMSGFLDTLHRDFEKSDFPANCVIVSHGMSIRVLLMRWFHMTVEDFELLKNPRNTQIITLVKQRDGKYKLAAELEKHKQAEHPYQFPISI